MPDIPVGSQIFDLAFHPSHSTVYTGLLTGQIKAFTYDEQGQHQQSFSVRPSKRSCRCLTLDEDGSKLWTGGKAKAIFTIDTVTGTVCETRKDAHESPINRMKHLMPHMFSTGDDDGVVKLWDPRKADVIRTHTHHFDFISDFLWLEDKKQLITSSGDGTLSVIDVRGKKTEPFAQSEDQEDELLSIVAIKSGSKVVVGTQSGILSIFNRSHGWADCVDRVPGHPQSIDALCSLPSSYPSSHSTVLTGSSDGLLRAVQLFPTKLLGVVADHGSFPIERIAIDFGGEGRWVGSAGHEDTLKMTDLKDVFEDEDDAVAEQVETEVDTCSDQGDKDGVACDNDQNPGESNESLPVIEASDDEEAQDSDTPKENKRKRKGDKDLTGKRKKGRNEIDAEPSFFTGL
ncbi:WD40-repeat-containing domain protein [Hygrophoropsis aurantiaca]|uniref:WD40-repeat-containing domain protein n=1 Tax=Hygrophoropsis aurantiaca TaxID=72124 RepID=A0ACB8AS13_9AGAM|nr:WD40-repeat-containing domain protein [Hygrophoropsis aurantiaca]